MGPAKKKKKSTKAAAAKAPPPPPPPPEDMTADPPAPPATAESYEVAPGRVVRTKRGIRSEGMEVLASEVGSLAKLLECGALVERKGRR